MCPNEVPLPRGSTSSARSESLRRRDRILKHKARKGDAIIPTDLELFFLELDAEFKANEDRQRVGPLQQNAFKEMRMQLQAERDRDTNQDRPGVPLPTSPGLATNALTEAVRDDGNLFSAGLSASQESVQRDGLVSPGPEGVTDCLSENSSPEDQEGNAAA
ncbi:hypothetical protein BJ741DRAFT_705371 [Chytriomyces cf. hyalinus JEL632]|nr:hypothetical protein BJ741DRAFT_705371 [Chytriomyces cf. hyalinus JEL632]